MKLRNKLIPFVAVATTASALMPMALTSCGANSTKLQDINSPEAAKPTFDPQYEKAQMYQWNHSLYENQRDAATADYIKFVKEDPSRFVQDLRWGVYQNWLSFYDNSSFSYTTSSGGVVKFIAEIKSLKFSATTPTFGTVDILYPHKGPDATKTFNTVSFKMHVDVEAVVKTYYGSSSDDTVSEKTIKTSSDVEYKNMLFFAYPSARNNKADLFLRYRFDSNYAYYGDFELLNPNPEVDTTTPGWFITISDDSVKQGPYQYYFDDYSITYKTNLEIQNRRKVGTLENVEVTTGSYDEKIDNAAKLNSLVNCKNYTYNDSILDWFNQAPTQIVANSVLMDTVSHYFSNSYAQGEMQTDNQLGGGIGNMNDFHYYEEVPYEYTSLHGWQWKNSPMSYDEEAELDYAWDPDWLDVYGALRLHFPEDIIKESDLTYYLELEPDNDLTPENNMESFIRDVVENYGDHSISYEDVMPEGWKYEPNRKLVFDWLIPDKAIEEGAENSTYSIPFYSYNSYDGINDLCLGYDYDYSEYTEEVYLSNGFYPSGYIENIIKPDLKANLESWLSEYSAGDKLEVEFLNLWAPAFDIIPEDNYLFTLPEGTKVVAHLVDANEEKVTLEFDVSGKSISLGANIK